MVIPDWSAPKRPPQINFVPNEHTVQNSLLARPLDRMAAMIVDLCVVLAPIYYLLSAPLRGWMTKSYLLGWEGDFFTTIVGMSGIAIGLVVFYQTFMHYFFKATLGKILFDLRVVAMFEDHKVSCWDCFVRSWFWVGEILCFGLPMLAVFSNSRRRPFHDRVADTVVISRNQNGVSGPAFWEQGLVKLVFSLALIAGLLVTVGELKGLSDKLKAESSVAALVERESGSCEVVDKNWDDSGEAKEHDRLKLAMSLYAAGLADRPCLEVEVEREMASQTPVGPITYLAQAFIYAEDAEVSNSYLDEVCKSSPDSVECRMSEVVSRWSDENWEGVEEALDAAPAGSGYLEVWGVRHFMKQARYDRALNFLSALSDKRELSEFILTQRVKALYNGFRTHEAEAALEQAMVALPQSESKELSSWMCVQQLQTSCDALKGPACGQVRNSLGKTSEIDFDLDGEALANVLAMECHGSEPINYLSFSEAVNSDDWRIFFQANSKQQKKDVIAAAQLYKQLIMSPEAPDLLKIEAARRWAQFAEGKQIQDLFEQWRDLSSREAWVKTGNILFKRVADLGQHEMAVRVAQYLAKAGSLSPQGMQTYMALSTDVQNVNRLPASVKKGSER